MEINFSIPTKIIMKRNCVYNSKELFKEFGNNALIVTGRKSSMINGSLTDVMNSLSYVGISYEIFNKVTANPTIDLVYEGAKVAKANNVDFIIAIGGGSAMDAAKAIAVLAKQDIHEDDLFTTPVTSEVLPMIFIPTTAGTGSEVTPYSIITNDKLETKSTIASPYLFPRLALLDGQYMTSLEKDTTINTALDALSHAIEGYLSVKASPMTKLLSREAITLIASIFKKLKSFDLSLEDRDKLLYASTLAGMVIAHAGTVAVHILGYSLTYYKHIDHGRANGLLLAAFLDVVSKTRSDLINEILLSLGMESISEFKDGLNGLMGNKETLTDEEIEKYVIKAMGVEKLKNTIVRIEESDLRYILDESMKG